MTYVLQGFAVLLGVSACGVLALSIANRNWILVPVHLVLIAVNVMLFIWQGSMR